jgi:hypothetical protein
LAGVVLVRKWDGLLDGHADLRIEWRPENAIARPGRGTGGEDESHEHRARDAVAAAWEELRHGTQRIRKAAPSWVCARTLPGARIFLLLNDEAAMFV